MRKTFQLMLLAVLCMISGSAMAALKTVTWTASENFSENTTIYYTQEPFQMDENLTLSYQEKGDNASKYTDGYLWLTSKNWLVLDVASGMKIQKVEFVFNENKDNSDAKMEAFDKNDKAQYKTAVGSMDNETGVWTGDVANVAFRSSKNRAIDAITVTYDDGQAEVEEPTESKIGITNMTAEVTAFNIQSADYKGVTFTVTLKNYAAEEAKDVELNIMQVGTNDVVGTEKFDMAANEEKTIDVLVDWQTAGTYKFYAKVLNSSQYDATWPASNSIEVTFTDLSETIDLAITAMQGTIDLDAEASYVTVFVDNNSAVDVTDAKVVLTVDGEEAELGEGTVSLKAGQKGAMCTIQVITEGLEAGTLPVRAEVVVENDANAEDNVLVQNFTVTGGAAVEATFSVKADDLEVELGAEKINVTMTVKNTSEVDAQNVEVKILNGLEELAVENIEALAAGEEKVLSIELNNPYTKAGKYDNLHIIVANKAEAFVNVTVKEVVEEVTDLAITAIQGQIDLNVENNTLSVFVNNNGTVDVNDAKVVLTVAGEEAELGEGTISVKAGKENAMCTIQIITDGLEAGTLPVHAEVVVENDATPEDNVFEKDVTVIGIPEAEATFSVAAENVTVAFGAESFDIVALVKNTSEVDAENVEVKLLEGINEVETKNIEKLAAGEEATVTFTLGKEKVLEAGKTAMYYVQVANKAQTEVEVKFAEEPVEQVVDLAIADISGTIDLNVADNYLTVFVNNNGTVDVNDAKVVLTVAGEEAELGEGTVSAKAGQENALCTIKVITDGLEEGTLPVHAEVMVENDAKAEDNVLDKDITVIGEAAPVAEISLNKIGEQEVTVGEQNIVVVATVTNNSEVAAKDVVVNLSKNLEVLATATIDEVPAAGTAYATLQFTYNFEKEGKVEFTVQADYMDDNTDNQTQDFVVNVVAEKADLTIAKIDDMEAAADEEVKVNITVKNLSAVAAQNVKVAVFEGTQEVGFRHTIEEIAANGEETIEFSLGTLEVGNHNFSAQITSEDANAENNVQTFAVKVSEAVEEVVDLAITQISGKIDLSLETNYLTVNVVNNGTVDVNDAVIKLTVDGEEAELGEGTVSVKAGSSSIRSIEIITDGLEAGTLPVRAEVIVENDVNAEDNVYVQEVNVADVAAPEATFSVTADDMEVELGAEKINVAMTVKNTSEVDAENVEVKILIGMEELAVENIEALAAGEEKALSIELNNPYTKAGKYDNLHIMVANKAEAFVNVTVKEVVEEVTDLAITAIQGQIDLNVENNTLSVFVNNNGTVDVNDAKVVLTVAGEEAELGEGTISVKAGKENAMCTIQIITDGLEEGTLPVRAEVVVENDATPEDNVFEKDVTVIGIPEAEPTFSVTAENVTVEFGAESFDIVALVKNTSEVDATDVEVKLLKSITTIETTTIAQLAAGEETTVTFTVDEILEAGKTALYYVQVANKAQTEVEVKFAEEPVEEKADLAVTAISGTIDLTAEANYLTVFVANNGTVDVNDAKVVLTVDGEEAELGEGTISVKAGKDGFCSILLITDGLEAGTLPVRAEVFVENDVNPDDNVLVQEFTVTDEVAAPELVIVTDDATVDVLDETFDVTITVMNIGEVDATDVEVKVYDGMDVLGTADIATIAAGSEETVTITLNNPYTKPGKYIQDLQVMAGNAGSWITVEVTDVTGVTTAINAIKAQYGENVDIYTLSGKKVNVNDLKKGIYVINGKKTVIK